jgi:glycosyltransferase involved in cell wall biosynthesis
MIQAVNHSSIRRVTSLIDRYCLRSADAVICHGPYLIDEVVSLGVRSERTLSFEVDLADWAESPVDGVVSEDAAGQGPVRILFVGRVEAEKGVFDLLEATRPLLEAQPAFRLQFLGDGGARETLAEQARQQGIASQVEILGPRHHEEVREIVHGASLVVAPSRPEFPEGRCMSIMEALALGVPVIGPRFGPFPYLIQDGINGRLFEPGSIRDLEQKLADALLESDSLEALANGAAEGRALFVTRSLTFGQAVNRAFDIARGNSP